VENEAYYQRNTERGGYDLFLFGESECRSFATYGDMWVYCQADEFNDELELVDIAKDEIDFQDFCDAGRGMGPNDARC
jgi:hypothetical protein